MKRLLDIVGDGFSWKYKSVDFTLFFLFLPMSTFRLSLFSVSSLISFVSENYCERDRSFRQSFSRTLLASTYQQKNSRFWILRDFFNCIIQTFCQVFISFIEALKALCKANPGKSVQKRNYQGSIWFNRIQWMLPLVGFQKSTNWVI